MVVATYGSTVSTATSATITGGIDPWQIWVDSATTNFPVRGSGVTTWRVWNTAAVTKHVSVTEGLIVNATWGCWNLHGDVQGIASRQIRQIAAPFVPRKKTDAEVQAELLREQERRRQEEERVAKHTAVKRRAEALLLSNLNAQQRDDLKNRGCFYLHTQSGKKYRIDRSTHGNVKLIDETGKILKGYCAQPNGVPTDDAILAQKLMLETDEPAFLRVANARNY